MPRDCLLPARPATLQWGLATDAHANGVHEACDYGAFGADWKPRGPCGMRMARLPWDMELSLLVWWKWLDPSFKRSGSATPCPHASVRRYGVPRQTHAHAIETGDPYPIKMLSISRAPILSRTWVPRPRAYAEAMKMDFNVVLDYVMTPTASAVCDLFLPIAMAAERTPPSANGGPRTRACMPVVAPQGEARSDNQITIDPINRLNSSSRTRSSTTSPPKPSSVSGR